MPYGRNLLTQNIVYPTRVSADGMPSLKMGGVTIDLTTLPAASTSPTTLGDQSVIAPNQQFLRYGQVLTKITAPATDTVTITGSPTGGTFTLSVTAGDSTQTTTALAYNANAATIQAALAALSNVGTGDVTVTGSGPFVLTYAASVLAVTTTASGAGLTGGTSPAVTVTTNAPGGNIGKYGPYDPNATDGRQTLTRGEAFVLDETFIPFPGGGFLPSENEIRGGVIEGGKIWIARVLQCGTGSASLAAGPTLANFLAVFPSFQLVEMT